MTCLKRLAVCAMFLGCGSIVLSAQPPRFNYQAKVTDNGGAALTGTHSCVFRIYEGGSANAEDSGTLRYEETSSLNLNVGILNHTVGTGTSDGTLTNAIFSRSADLFLQVSIDSNALLPRTRLESVPFAISAANGEVRTPIDPSAPGFSTPVVIVAPGSYYLTANIPVTTGDAIEIAANGVTLDLNGFTLSSTSSPASGWAIRLSGYKQRNIAIRNGNIESQRYAGTGFLYGIYYTNFSPNSPSGIRVSAISVSEVQSDGINVPIDSASVVEQCSVEGPGGIGIRGCEVSHCSARLCVDHGIFAETVSDCSAICLQGVGIECTVATNCRAVGDTGIVTSIASNCKGTTEGGGYGVSVTNTATNCFGHSISGTGLLASIAKGCQGDSQNGIGLYATIGADNCYGTTQNVSQPALKVGGTANGCSGLNYNGGVAVQAVIGVACCTFGGTMSIPAGGKFLGTP